MSAHSTYDMLRHLADSWGLLAMLLVFLALALWPFRPGAGRRNHDAANLIFKDDHDGE
ncbi:cbb3-type cytochrome c oxidase subunit 3 [Altererythrobacter sp. Root672]|uniref:cbb3-type cytochrome c oxidase subunit 3 n=1 Tax=Altererythrobacter sp. Root672 TaxID=1736584 RepID=UPI000700B792|nr:cbb3-type cytochrome c oxidase subunit 3 [Altererythrobacter sp. Root672]KRA84486.1 cytochrome C oxidase Cbb3 [Altererythrobacter sp. Root672]